MKLIDIIKKQKSFSLNTFGPGERSSGLVDHIRKELLEIEADPLDLTEWMDVVILALDGAWRAGHSPEDIVAGLIAKQAKNENRQWPDWKTAAPGKAIEHIKDTNANDDTDASELGKQVGGDHYKKMGIYQPWIVLSKWLTDEELKGGMKSVVIPYLAREADKGGREDLKKAHHTLGIYLELTEPKKVDEPKDLGQTISNLTSRTELALPPERKKAKRQLNWTLKRNGLNLDDMSESDEPKKRSFKVRNDRERVLLKNLINFPCEFYERISKDNHQIFIWLTNLQFQRINRAFKAQRNQFRKQANDALDALLDSFISAAGTTGK